MSVIEYKYAHKYSNHKFCFKTPVKDVFCQNTSKEPPTLYLGTAFIQKFQISVECQKVFLREKKLKQSVSVASRKNTFTLQLISVKSIFGASAVYQYSADRLQAASTEHESSH